MKNWINKNYKTMIISAFLIPIFTVAAVSISHVTKWYGISNPMTWAIYLSVGIEIAALSALAAISADMGKKVYFPFGIVTLIQFIGNIYFTYSYIDVTSQAFKSWVELVSPIVDFMGVDNTDFVGHKRFLSFFAGGMLPIISLTFLDMLVKFTKETKETTNTPEEKREVIDAKDIVSEVSRIRLSDDDLTTLENILKRKTPSEDIEIKNEQVFPAISDEEVNDMNMDEWERKNNLPDDETNDSLPFYTTPTYIDNFTTQPNPDDFTTNPITPNTIVEEKKN